MPEKVYPKITVVNDEDEVIGYFPLFDALAQSLTRRVSAIFALDKEGNILIQRRSTQVLYPNLLDFSAAGHVNEGDDYLSCARAELFEELGIKNSEFTLVAPPFKTLDFFTAVYKIVIERDAVMNISSEEVENTFWVSIQELKEMIIHRPEQFTQSFLAAWPQVCDKIKI